MPHDMPPTEITMPDGQKMSLADFPITVYTLTCGHTGRNYGVLAGDLVFCDDCQTRANITDCRQES